MGKIVPLMFFMAFLYYAYQSAIFILGFIGLVLYSPFLVYAYYSGKKDGQKLYEMATSHLNDDTFSRIENNVNQAWKNHYENGGEEFDENGIPYL